MIDDDIRSMPETVVDGDEHHYWGTLNHPDYKAPKDDAEKLIEQQKKDDNEKEPEHQLSTKPINTRSASPPPPVVDEENRAPPPLFKSEKIILPDPVTQPQTQAQIQNEDALQIHKSTTQVPPQNENMDPDIVTKKCDLIIQLSKWKVTDKYDINMPLSHIQHLHRLEKLKRRRIGHLKMTKKAVTLAAGGIAFVHNQLDPILPFMKTGIDMGDWQREVDHALQTTDEIDDALEDIADQFMGLSRTASTGFQISSFLLVSYVRALKYRMDDQANKREIERLKQELEQKQIIEDMNKKTEEDSRRMYANQAEYVNSHMKKPFNPASHFNRTQQASEKVDSFIPSSSDSDLSEGAEASESESNSKHDAEDE